MFLSTTLLSSPQDLETLLLAFEDLSNPGGSVGAVQGTKGVREEILPPSYIHVHPRLMTFMLWPLMATALKHALCS